VPEKLPLVRANADRLLQVMVNLLMNAADAIEGRGQVDITVSHEEAGWLEIRVADSGPGIPPDVLEHVFEPFFSTKPPGRGTGLGLAICESIVDGFGGSLDVDGGGAGSGACFSVRAPTLSPSA
jgi:signal transduction histidine kinase